MMDREKVIKGLECCAECGKCKSECPYDGKNDSLYGCTTQLAKDALEVLKAQEGMLVESIANGKSHRECSNCHSDITVATMWHTGKYCPDCGCYLKQKIKK